MVARYAWSGRERLGLVRVRGDVLVLHAMRWPDVRSPQELLPPPVEVTEEEIEGTLALMESMSRDDLEGAEFRDTYTDALAEIIEAKREDKPLPDAPGQVLDLMAALAESVSKAKASRGEDADVHELPRKKAAAKKQTSAKAATKKQPAKKTASNKTAARRPRSA
ncbi:hypothetical protein ACFXDO_25280 [Streptomyces nigra]|uniref:hypothetical protein n=1 Tax=Streptomyces nigra TaxID=1827580 RepID=UPI00367DB7BB